MYIVPNPTLLKGEGCEVKIQTKLVGEGWGVFARQYLKKLWRMKNGGKKYKVCYGDEIILYKFFLKVVVLGTTKQWSNHTDLLVFCGKFRHLSACEYLNYYYNKTNVNTNL